MRLSGSHQKWDHRSPLSHTTNTVSRMSRGRRKWASSRETSLVGSRAGSARSAVRCTHHCFAFLELTKYIGYAATNSSQSDDALATIGWGQGYDLTMVSGLRMGNLIFQSLEYAFVLLPPLTPKSPHLNCTQRR